MPSWPWQAREPARKRSRTPSESEAGEALHFEDSDFYAQPSAGPAEVQQSSDEYMGGKGGNGEGMGGPNVPSPFIAQDSQNIRLKY